MKAKNKKKQEKQEKEKKRKLLKTEAESELKSIEGGSPGKVKKAKQNKDKEKSSGKEKSRGKEKNRDKEKNRGKEKAWDKDKNQDKEKIQDQEKTQDKGKNKDKIKEKSQEKEKKKDTDKEKTQAAEKTQDVRVSGKESQSTGDWQRAKETPQGEEIPPRRKEKKESTSQKAQTELSASGIQPADVFRALGDEVRLQILDLLRGKELCGAELLKSLSIVQSTLSHHMKTLCETGVVKCRKQGRWSYYSVNPEAFEVVGIYLRQYGKKQES